MQTIYKQISTKPGNDADDADDADD